MNKSIPQHTCTHHTDQQRTACPVCLVTALTAERDQLRSENSNLRAGQKSCEACDEPTAFEVRQLRAELAAEREKAERYRLATLKLDAELAEMHKSFAGNVHMENRELQTELATERARMNKIKTALKDAISTYFGDDKLVTAERIEAWQAALKEDAK